MQQLERDITLAPTTITAVNTATLFRIVSDRRGRSCHRAYGRRPTQLGRVEDGNLPRDIRFSIIWRSLAKYRQLQRGRHADKSRMKLHRPTSNPLKATPPAAMGGPRIQPICICPSKVSVCVGVRGVACGVCVWHVRSTYVVCTSLGKRLAVGWPATTAMPWQTKQRSKGATISILIN